jgi:hypothetical protein
MKEMLTEEHKSMLKYFWEEKGDIERYCDFEKLKPIIQEEYPELLKAWYDYKTSIRTMNAICNSL